MLSLTPDQIRLLLALTADDWWVCENEKGFDNQALTGRQVELERIQEKLREALKVSV